MRPDIDHIEKSGECEQCEGYNSETCHHSGYWTVHYVDGGTASRKCDHREAFGLRQKSEAMLKSSKLSPRFAQRTFETFKASGSHISVLRACRAFCDQDHSDGVGIAFTGPVGTGKTHLAAAILNDWLGRQKLGVFVVMSDFFGELRIAMNNQGDQSTDEIIDAVASAPLLVLDDMGVDKASAWQASAIYRIINKRYEHFLPTVVTTNLSHEEMPVLLGHRAYDRLLECCDWHEVEGESYRRKIARERMK